MAGELSYIDRSLRVSAVLAGNTPSRPKELCHALVHLLITGNFFNKNKTHRFYKVHIIKF